MNSTDAYYAAQFDAYNWSRSEVRDNIRNSLLRREVSFAVDDSARATASDIQGQVGVANADLAAIAKAATDAGKTNVTYADAGTIPLTSQDPNGIIKAVRGLDTNGASGLIRGVDGYYVAKLVEKTGTTIHYAYVKVGLMQFAPRRQEDQRIHKDHDRCRASVTSPRRLPPSQSTAPRRQSKVRAFAGVVIHFM
jgi:hypothetical protein